MLSLRRARKPAAIGTFGSDRCYMAAQPEGQAERVSSMNEPHQARLVPESFDSDAERDDRARPCYPDVMVEAIVAASPGPSVLDVGCGTGLAARHFQAVGCRVLGVDPGADCRPGAAVRGRGRGGEGTGPTPGMSGWTWSLPLAATASSHRPSSRICWRVSAPPSTRWGAVSGWLHRDSGHRGAIRYPRARPGPCRSPGQTAKMATLFLIHGGEDAGSALASCGQRVAPARA